MNNKGDRRPEIIVVGGGFAGINLVRGLNRAPVSIVLVDKHNYHLFQPLLYQVATAELLVALWVGWPGAWSIWLFWSASGPSSWSQLSGCGITFSPSDDRG